MAVYTRVSIAELNDFLANYNIGKAQRLDGITEGVENSNYQLITDDSGDYILTLYEKRVKPADLPYFINLMEHLASRDITCPHPIADNNGVVLKKLNDKAAAIFSFLDGSSNNIPSAERCYAAGIALAELHIASMGFNGRRDNALNHLAWGTLLAEINDSPNHLFKYLTIPAKTYLDETLAYWPTNLPSGVIHADFFPDNVLFTNDAVTGVIDFYFACDGFFAYDLSIAVNAWCFDDEFSREKYTALLNGYQSARKLTPAEIAAIPILCRGAAMRFFLTRLYDWINTPTDAQVTPHDPRAYWARLEFHHGVNGKNIADVYGVE
ncbi:MAG: homoserine kinase [Candidatus Puniceispirillales bacterium WSBS_2018_MAG_OTU23]